MLGHNKGVNPTGRSAISQENYSDDLGKNYLGKRLGQNYLERKTYMCSLRHSMFMHLLHAFCKNSVHVLSSYTQTNFQLNFSYQLWPSNHDNNGKYSYDK